MNSARVTTTDEFMGVDAKITLSDGKSYRMLFPQGLVGMHERQKSWMLTCKSCQDAAATRVPAWSSSIFYTGVGEYDEAEQRDQWAKVLAEVEEHIGLHRRMATWYELLIESPAFREGYMAGKKHKDVFPKVTSEDIIALGKAENPDGYK